MRKYGTFGPARKSSTIASGGVRAAGFSPDGQRIVTGCWDQMAKVWDATTRELLTLKGHINSVWSVAFSPAGNEGACEQLSGVQRNASESASRW